jgi:hypothetical protein
MNIYEHMRNLKSKYGETATENLALPLSERGWRLLTELHELVGMPLPELLERLIEDAHLGEWWTEWNEGNERMELITWH